MADYYKVDSRKVSLREYWNISPTWKALIPWIAARLNMPLSMGTGFRQIDDVRELEVGEPDFLPQARTKLQPLLDECLQRGCYSPRYYSYEDIRGRARISFISLLHESGEFTVRLMHTLAGSMTPPKESMYVVLLSELSDGRFFFTSNRRPSFRGPPGIIANRLVGAKLGRLIDSHRNKLAELASRNPPKNVKYAPDLDDTWNRYERFSRDDKIKRGLYVRMTDEELQGLQKKVEEKRALTASGVPHADVLAELYSQEKKGGWANSLLLLVISAVLFVGISSRRWSWEYVLLLVPILLVHESGHYFAMRAFHYRNLRMFFIPLFGAAVSGRHYNVPGWKKVIVSMMGPVPGIILGAVIGGVGLALHQTWLIKAGLVTELLNGINLLPVLPLDGGWIFHTLLFSRHHLLDAAFRLLAAIVLVVAGARTDDKLLLYLGVLMLVGIPAAYRLARITTTLRERGMPTASPDDQTLPTETAVIIIDELKKSGLPKVHSNKMAAAETLKVFETLNARAPGWSGTVALLLAYFMSLAMAAVFAWVFITAQRGDLGNFLAALHPEPKRSLVCGGSTSRGTRIDEDALTAKAVIIANFPNQAAADRSFQDLTSRLPGTLGLETFGESVLLILPAAESALRKQWFDQLQKQAKDVFVDGSNSPARFSISCRFSSEAQAAAVRDELEEYAVLDRSLVPPWYPADPRTPEQRAANQLARRSYLKAYSAETPPVRDPRLSDLQKRMNQAQRQGDDAELVALMKQITNLSSELFKERLERVKNGAQGRVDPMIIDLIASLPAEDGADDGHARDRITDEIARRMGRLPDLAGSTNSVDQRFSLGPGLISGKGKTLQLAFVSFKRIDCGAPALLDWLCSKGGTGFKYDLEQGFGADDDR